MNFVIGRDNLAITIFVPYDCNNNCPFCTSKKEYREDRDKLGTFSTHSIIESIEKLSAISHCVTDIVITGGEPFANLNELGILLYSVNKYFPNKAVYINTTLPIRDIKEYYKFDDFISKFSNVITGINVSRHLADVSQFNVGSQEQLSMALLSMLKHFDISLKVNCVVPNGAKNISLFLGKYGFAQKISFRADYTKIKTQDDLRTLQDPFLDVLFDECKYLHSGGCMVCNDDVFLHGCLTVSYHRGFEHSLVIKGDTYIVNDIVVKQDGSIYLDWDESLYGDKTIVDRMIEKLTDRYEQLTSKDISMTCAEAMEKNKKHNKKCHETFTCGVIECG